MTGSLMIQGSYCSPISIVAWVLGRVYCGLFAFCTSQQPIGFFLALAVLSIREICSHKKWLGCNDKDKHIGYLPYAYMLLCMCHSFPASLSIVSGQQIQQMALSCASEFWPYIYQVWNFFAFQKLFLVGSLLLRSRASGR